MTDIEFMEACQQFYRSEIGRGRKPSVAHRATERFRSGLIVALATQSAIRAGLIPAKGAGEQCRRPVGEGGGQWA